MKTLLGFSPNRVAKSRNEDKGYAKTITTTSAASAASGTAHPVHDEIMAASECHPEG